MTRLVIFIEDVPGQGGLLRVQHGTLGRVSDEEQAIAERVYGMLKGLGEDLAKRPQIRGVSLWERIRGRRP